MTGFYRTSPNHTPDSAETQVEICTSIPRLPGKNRLLYSMGGLEEPSYAPSPHPLPELDPLPRMFVREFSYYQDVRRYIFSIVHLAEVSDIVCYLYCVLRW